MKDMKKGPLNTANANNNDILRKVQTSISKYQTNKVNMSQSFFRSLEVLGKSC